MADADDRDEGDKPRRKTSMKPKAGVIDLEATEIEKEAAADDPAADDPAASADPDGTEAEPRSQIGGLIAAGFAGAAIAIGGFVILLAADLIPIRGGDPALGSRIADLETRVDAVQDRTAAPPAYDDSALRSDLAALQQDIGTLKEEVGAIRAAPPAAGGDAELAARVEELTGRVDQIARMAEGRAMTAALDQLAARVDEIAAVAADAKSPDPGVQDAMASASSAKALAAVASLEGAVARGVPYAEALKAVRRHVPGANADALQAGAESGLSSPAVLAERLSAALDRAPAPPSTADGLVERLTEGAWNLVRVRPVDGSVPAADESDPWSVRNAVTVRLRQGDYAGALADWRKLDDAAKQATRADAEALRTRLEAEQALDALRAAALEAQPETAR